jgi:hypothetical protein
MNEKITAGFTAVSIITMEHYIGNQTSKHLYTEMYLQVSANLDKHHYVKDDGGLTNEGCKAATIAFIEGLVANIHAAHQEGHWDSAEHLRFIISNLEKGFIRVTQVRPAILGENSK